MEVYEVFRRTGHKDPFEHCGAVIAPDPGMAAIMAKECFIRRGEGEHLWVVPRSEVHPVGRDEGTGEVADKSYRYASAYRGVVEKRARAKQRASQAKAATSAPADAPSAPPSPVISTRRPVS